MRPLKYKVCQVAINCKHELENTKRPQRHPLAEWDSYNGNHPGSKVLPLFIRQKGRV